MKRAVALLLVLTVFGAAGLVCAHRVVGASAETVEMYETVLAGDRAAAEGVELRFETRYRGNLWDTALRVGAENETETDFHVSTKWELDTSLYVTDPISFVVGVSDNVCGESISEEHELYALISDLLSHAPPGETHLENIHLRDYYEYMPLYVNVVHRWSAEKELVDEEAFERQLRELFEIPVPEGCYLSAGLEKDRDGKLLSWEVYPRGGAQDVEMDLETISTELGCWFVGHLSHGSGKYECAGADKLWFRPAEYAGGAYADRAGEIIHIMDMDPGEQALDLRIDALGQLIMLTERYGTYYLRVIDTDSGMPAQKLELELLAPGEDYGVNRLYMGADFLVAYSTQGSLQVCELTVDGQYRLGLSGELEIYEFRGEISFSPIRTAMLWDGERLIVTSPVYSNKRDGRGERLQGAALWVYDGTGLAFSAYYDSSLCLPETEEPMHWVSLWRLPKLSLR